MTCKPTDSEKIYIFDSLFTNNHIQILKIVFSGVSPSLQKVFAPFIKYLELQYTIGYLTKQPVDTPVNSQLQINTSSGLDFITQLCDLIQEFSPFLSGKEKEQFSKFQEMSKMMKSFQEIQTTLEEFEKSTGIKISDLMGNDNQQMDLLQKLMGGIHDH